VAVAKNEVVLLAMRSESADEDKSHDAEHSWECNRR
jgi:hypothetical protein